MTGLTRWRVVCMVAAVVALAAVAVSAVALASRPYAPTKQCTEPRIKPNVITIACADDNAYVNRLSWRHWGHHRARGVGLFVLRNPRTGNTHRYPANAVLSDPRKTKCGGKTVELFLDLHLHFTDGKPKPARPWRDNKLYCTP